MLHEATRKTSSMPSIPAPNVRVAGDHGAFIVMAAAKDADSGDEAARAYEHIADTVATAGMEIVQERIFGSLSVEQSVRAARRTALQERGIGWDGPVTYVQGRPTWGDGFAGVIVRAVCGNRVSTLYDGDGPCGRSWQTGGTTFAILQNMGSSDPGSRSQESAPAQSRRAIYQADTVLRRSGLCYADVVRTWFYLSSILDWYGEFNQIRTQAYRTFGLMPSPGHPECRLPASTGIRADTAGGAACSLDLLAVRRSDASAGRVEYLKNSRQKEAYCYGSAFSRCAVVQGMDGRLIQVSGTAAIDEKGMSLYPGDVRGQARCTLQRLESLLDPIDASLHDICAATVFLKRGEDEQAVRAVLEEEGLTQIPAVWVTADVCRDELLFEIDAEAVVSTPVVREKRSSAAPGRHSERL